MAAIPLPAPESGSSPLEELLAARRSRRAFGGEGISLGHLSRLLFAAQGVTGESGGVQLQTAASAGALYPLFSCLPTTAGTATHLVDEGSFDVPWKAKRDETRE